MTKFQEGEVLCLDKRSGSVVWSNSFSTQQPWSVEVYDKDLQKIVPRKCFKFPMTCKTKCHLSFSAVCIRVWFVVFFLQLFQTLRFLQTHVQIKDVITSAQTPLKVQNVCVRRGMSSTQTVKHVKVRSRGFLFGGVVTKYFIKRHKYVIRHHV